jgi:hypothetical protein
MFAVLISISIQVMMRDVIDVASVPIPPRQDPPTRHYGLRRDRNRF